MKPAVARALFESLGDELAEVDVDGRRAWLPARSRVPAPVDGVVRLLPQYDVYLVGFREREQLVPERAREWLQRHLRGRLEGPVAVPWLVVDGVVAGSWTRKRDGKRIEIAVEPFEKLSRPLREALQDEAARIGAFYGLEPKLTIG